MGVNSHYPQSKCGFDDVRRDQNGYYCLFCDWREKDVEHYEGCVRAAGGPYMRQLIKQTLGWDHS